MKLSRAFEKALQAVEPAMTLPYHDMSIETTNVDNGMYNSTFDETLLWSVSLIGAKSSPFEHLFSTARQCELRGPVFSRTQVRWVVWVHST